MSEKIPWRFGADWVSYKPIFRSYIDIYGYKIKNQSEITAVYRHLFKSIWLFSSDGHIYGDGRFRTMRSQEANIGISMCNYVFNTNQQILVFSNYYKTRLHASGLRSNKHSQKAHLYWSTVITELSTITKFAVHVLISKCLLQRWVERLLTVWMPFAFRGQNSQLEKRP